jgi:hypothetical protein
MKKYIAAQWSGDTTSIFTYDPIRATFVFFTHVPMYNNNVPTEVATVLRVRLRLGEQRPEVITDDGGNILVGPV